jgi:glyoxylase-like metal-dependent hydrolase (beta-lactamase superfamily II)
MKTEIHRLSLGMCNCYLIKEDGLILVEAGVPNQGKKFRKLLKDLSIEPGDVSLILLTHGHWDHIASISEIKKLTGCKVAINQHEKDWVEQAIKSQPPGNSLTGKVLTAIINAYLSFIDFTGTTVDLVLEDKEYSLESYGIHGRIIYTPGHSSGSMSLLLETGDAFVGDLALGGFPMRIGPGMPIWVENVNALKESWRLLLSSGAKQIYPAHGKPFNADVLEKLL